VRIGIVAAMTTVHDFAARRADGTDLLLREYAGKVVLIVNVASKCGLTPQYEGLEAMYRDLHERGLEILGFPCNQFMGQEPGTDAEIQEFCRTTYDVSFPVFGKVDVNGPQAHPLFQHLRRQTPLDGDGADEVQWNFTKFLVGRDGEVIKRYEPRLTPGEIRDEVAAQL
jgi:glutathione peroxidase